MPGGGKQVLAFSQQAADLAVTSPGWYLIKPSSGDPFLFPALSAGPTYVLVLPGGRLVCTGRKIQAGRQLVLHTLRSC